MNNKGILRGNNVIKYMPGQSVVKLNVGDKIRLTADEFERLSAAFFAELERKFLEPELHCHSVLEVKPLFGFYALTGTGTIRQ